MKIKLIKPSCTMSCPIPGRVMLDLIEQAGRTCYKSETKITKNSSEEFVRMIIKRGHESVLEHHGFSVRFICDRGISHELVRHRIASFSQESTRYVGYKDAAEFIIPSWMDLEPVEFDAEDSIFICELWEGKSQADIWWMGSMIDAAIKYSCLLKENWRPEQARSILPNSLKTEIVMTANLREWRHFFKLRTSDAAHPDMRAITRPLLEGVKKTIPVVFEDL